MMVISERINGLFRAVGAAIDRRDADAIRAVAARQAERGADALDLNVGPGRGDGAPEAMRWLVETVQSATSLPLCIDSPSAAALEAGLSAAENPTIVNSATADPAKMERVFPLAADHGSDVICLTMDARGVPNDADSRGEMAMLMMTTAMEHGLMPERLLLDPLVLPLGAAQDQAAKVVEAVRAFQTLDDPAPRTVVGLSNISNGAADRSLVNRTFLAMLAGAGLTAAIMDPEDSALMDAMRTADVLTGRKLYCSDYLRGR